MSKYVIKRKIPKYQEAGEVGSYMLGNMDGIQGLGIEPLVNTNQGLPAPVNPLGIYSLDTPDQLRTKYANAFDQDNVFPASFKGSLQRIAENYQDNGITLNNITVNDVDKSKTGSGETDVFDFTTIPYYGADDIGSRFTQMGRGIGRMRSEGYGDLSTGAKTANTITTIASGISGIMGLARNVVSGIASEKGTRTNIRLAQEREARQRRQSQMQYKDGGGVYLGPNNRFDSGSLTGEYLYPLPKSMEDQANVEVEKGEYVEQPGEAPMEAMGQKHADGGTPVSLEQGTEVVTDDTIIEPDFAKYIRDTYGIKATPKDTYATLMDRYKVKIGLKSAYDDQKKALEKLKKNDKIDDENTRRLNASVLSKAINDSNDTVNGLEGRFTDFANVIYKEQEDRKMKKDEDTYFAKGGEIDNIISRSMKEYGLTEEDIAEAKKELLKKVAGIRQKMEIGGTSLFGRKLTFRPIENRFNNDLNYFGYQRQGTDGSYGGINTDERLNYYKTFNPVAYDAGITHFSQLFSDKNKDVVNKILGEDMLKMQALRSMKGMEGLDFILDPHKVAPGPMDIGDVEEPDVKLDMPELIDPNTLPKTNTNAGKSNSGNGGRNIVGGGLDFPEVFRMTPGAVTTEGLERHYAPTVDPVLRSADQYMVEANRAFQSQLDQMGNVPDSQRGALSSNLQAIMSSNIGRYINEVEQGNVAQRTWADNVNARTWTDTYDKNIAQRQGYQSRILQALANTDENWARYFDSVNDEIQQKWNTATTMNTLRSIFGDVKIGPNGQLIADPQGDILSYRRLYPAQEVTKGKKG